VFSPDGRRLAGSNWDESISVWDADAPADPDLLEAHRARRRQSAQARAQFWHLTEAEHCLEHRNVPAARFHVKRLGKAPLPGLLQARKERLVGELDRHPGL
jgi:hypothetical protein